MNFDDIQKSWRSQPVGTPEDPVVIHNRLSAQWRKQQRGVWWSNVATTAAFGVTLIVLTWVYLSFHQSRSIFFSAGLFLMAALMLAYLVVIWKGIAFKKNEPSLPSKAYITQSLSKLYWRRNTITHYTWIYGVLLWLSLMFYCIDVTEGGSLWYKIGAPAAITVYIFGLLLTIRFTKQKKQLAKIDQLIADMKQLNDRIGDAG